MEAMAFQMLGKNFSNSTTCSASIVFLVEVRPLPQEKEAILKTLKRNKIANL